MDIKQLVKDLEKIAQDCSDKMTDLDEVDENLTDIITELKQSQEYENQCKPKRTPKAK